MRLRPHVGFLAADDSLFCKPRNDGLRCVRQMKLRLASMCIDTVHARFSFIEIGTPRTRIGFLVGSSVQNGVGTMRIESTRWKLLGAAGALSLGLGISVAHAAPVVQGFDGQKVG